MSKKKKRARIRAEREAAVKACFLDPDYAAVHSQLSADAEDPHLLAWLRGVNPPHHRVLGPRTPESTATVNPALLAQLLALRDVKLAPANPEEFTKNFTFVLGGNGVLCYHKTRVGLVGVPVMTGTIPGLPHHTSISGSFHSTFPKLPFHLLATAVAFLRWVKDTHDTEGLIRAYWNSRDGWQLHVPEQLVSGASVEVSDDVEDPQLGVFALEIHSHPGSSSVFSSVDDEHEQLERIFGCVADVGTKAATPNFHWRVGTGQKLWLPLNTVDLIAESETPLTFSLSPLACLNGSFRYDPFSQAVFPPEWQNKVSKRRGGMLGPGTLIRTHGGYVLGPRTPDANRQLPAHYQSQGVEAKRPATTDRFDSGVGVGSRVQSFFGR